MSYEKNNPEVTGATEENITANAEENIICSHPNESSDNKESDKLKTPPTNVKATMFTIGYYLMVLCLCWLLRNSEKCEERYVKIKNVANLKNRGDIFKCLKEIIKDTPQGKCLLRRIEGIRPIILAAGVSIIYDLKKAGKLTPHHFCAIRDFDNFKFQVQIKEPDIGFRTFNVFDYYQIIELYQNEKNTSEKEKALKEEDTEDTFETSKAITSLCTDIVLSCFMDRDPNLHITSSGSKWNFAKMINFGELEFEVKDGKRKKLKNVYDQLDLSVCEPCSRSASVSIMFHRFF